MFFVWILQKSQRFFAWVSQKRQPSHIKRMTAFFDNSILSDKNALLLDFLRQHRHGSVLCADVSPHSTLKPKPPRHFIYYF